MRTNKRQISKESWIKRLRMYWNANGFLKFNSHIGEIYEVDFGENIGSEFSGRHLAICLSDTKTTDERMLVIPLTSRYKEFNIEHVVNTVSFNGKIISAGIVLNEVKYISKLRVFKSSKILGESESDNIIPVGYVKLDKKDLNRFRRMEI